MATLDPRTIESYLRANSAPRFMRRLRDIELQFRTERRRLETAHRQLVHVLGHDPERFSRRWRSRARAWRFDRLNELIRQHNDWYPVEANLPMDPRTRDYRPIRGQSYRRLELGPDWVLEHFPADPAAAPMPVRSAPREPLAASGRWGSDQGRVPTRAGDTPARTAGG